MAKTPAEIAHIGEQIHFEATHHWLEGKYKHPDALLAALRERPRLADYEDELGNTQGAVRLDYDPEGREGLWVTVPEQVGRQEIEEAAKNYEAKVKELHPDDDAS